MARPSRPPRPSQPPNKYQWPEPFPLPPHRPTFYEATTFPPRPYPRTKDNMFRWLENRGSFEIGAAESTTSSTTEEEMIWEMRHGWEDLYASEEYLAILTTAFYMYYTDKRHDTGGNPRELEPFEEWRMRDRLKTVSAALAICLNIGVDPPDVIKTNPCAKLEAWVDPSTHPGGPKAMETIGKNLQQQYETLSIRTRYRQYLDPSIEEIKKCCTSLRRNAKDERILFHYNGHGVPRPTLSGEIWVFNKNYTQYIPVSLYDLQGWLGSPCLYVFDCSDAGNIVNNFDRFIEKHLSEQEDIKAKDPNAQLLSFSDSIILAACHEKETLPTSPELPADLFTCCLTTPIEIALRFFVLQRPLTSKITIETVMRLPGRLQERRTPMGELNWIFTAITDTIAWNTLPRTLFKRLFRQDLMVAALFRNFILCQRVMRVHNCHPMSYPALPETHHHPLWQSWDMAVEMCLSQLPAMIEAQELRIPYEYQHSTFFTEQLTAFDVYLRSAPTKNKPPHQLPIVLQVLLSQVHRLRALVLLSKFLDLGQWAVNLALSIGIFPYVLKLLQSAAIELKPVMVFIWARILAIDPSVQTDLLKDNGYMYFMFILTPSNPIPIPNVSEHRAMCAFIMTMFCRNFHQGQVVSLNVSPGILDSCLAHITDTENPLLRQWACLCLSQLWIDFPEAKWMGIRESAHIHLCDLWRDPEPEVRCGMVYALTTFLGIPDLTDQVAAIEEILATRMLLMSGDGNIMVRKELLVFFSTFVKRYEHKFVVTAFESILEEKDMLLSPPRSDGSENQQHHSRRNSLEDLVDTSRAISASSIFQAIWKHLLILSADPYPEVSRNAGIIVDYVLTTLMESPLERLTEDAMKEIKSTHTITPIQITPNEITIPSAMNSPRTSLPPSPKKENYLSTGLKKTLSVATSLRKLAFGSGSSPEPSPTSFGKDHAKRDINYLRANGLHRDKLPGEWNQPPDQNDPLSSSGAYVGAKAPLSKNFKPRCMEEVPHIPLESTFLAWSMEYFREPQMRPNEADEPGSADYNHRLWRRTRNEKIITLTQPQKEEAGTGRWDVSAGSLNNGSQPTRTCFHQFEDHLAVADDRDTVCIWDWAKASRLSRFSNGNPSGSKINEIRFINEDDQALLLTGSSDGVIKIYRNYEYESKTVVLCAFRALTDLVRSNFNAGLRIDWQQGQGKLLVAGNVKVIKVWNAATEISVNEIPARSGSPTTSLTSDQVAGDVFVAGFGDGAIRVYDQRLRPQDAMVKVWKEHKQWISKVHMQRGGLRELLSGCRNGDVKMWDLRLDESINTIQATRDTLRTLSVHEHAPTFAVGTGKHRVTIFNTNGAPLSMLEPHASFLTLNSLRTTPISTTSFHPHRMMLACSSLNNYHINLFECPTANTNAKIISWDGDTTRPPLGSARRPGAPPLELRSGESRPSSIRSGIAGPIPGPIMPILGPPIIQQKRQGT